MLQTNLANSGVEIASGSVRPLVPSLKAWGMHAGDEPMQVREPDFRQLAGIVRRRCPSILAIAASGAVLAGVIGISIPPKYTATAQVLIDPRASSVDELEPSTRGIDDAAVESIVDTHVGMLTSRAFLQRVLASLPEASRTRSDGDVDRSKVVADASANEQAAATSLPGLAELERRLKIWANLPDLDEFERRIKVVRERRSRIISVSFTSTTPTVAADVANRTVQAHIDARVRQQKEFLARDVARLGDQIATLKAETLNAAAAAQGVIQNRPDARRASGPDALFPDQRMRQFLNEATAARELQPKLERRVQDLTNQQEHLKGDAQILSLASPPNRPSSPNPVLFIFPSLIAFSICGVLLAVARERLDQGLRSQHDVVNALGISCIGLVPQLGRRARKRSHRRLLSEPSLAYTESIRSIVAQLQLASSRRAPKVILVSSSVPREGKTTLAVSLASYAAFLRRRVLLVDLDFQHPSVFRELKRSRLTVGSEITDLLLQDQMPTKFIEHLSDLQLDYFPLAHCPADPLSLFGGDHLPRLKSLLCENYDCVVLDGPPLLSIAEARLLAPLADQVLFVVKWGSTRRDVAQTALDMLRSGCLQSESARPPVAVITQVNLKKHARYRFGDVTESIVKYRNHYTRVQA